MCQTPPPLPLQIAQHNRPRSSANAKHAKFRLANAINLQWQDVFRAVDYTMSYSGVAGLGIIEILLMQSHYACKVVNIMLKSILHHLIL
jgi:hypothetical protein